MSIITFFYNILHAQRHAAAIAFERDRADTWYDRCVEHAKARADAEAENATLRSQINQRGAGGKFVKKNT